MVLIMIPKLSLGSSSRYQNLIWVAHQLDNIIRVQIEWVTSSKFLTSFMIVPKDDLWERGWTFSTHLWNSSSYINNQSNQSFNTFPPMEKSGKKKSKSRLHSVVTETSFHQRRRRYGILLPKLF